MRSHAQLRKGTTPLQTSPRPSHAEEPEAPSPNLAVGCRSTMATLPPTRQHSDRAVAIEEDQRIKLSWHDLSYSVTVKPKKGSAVSNAAPERDGDAKAEGESAPMKKALLQHVSGTVKPGELMAIMGPSGSGKTTLLDVLARRASFGQQEGEVLANGNELSLRDCRQYVSYVAQEDTLMGVFTVRETLMYSALFTLPRSLAKAEKEQRVEAVLESCGLSQAADVIVGNLFLKGLSGGQKRRLSLAVELIRNPPVILLDEPTSGLDATSAMGIVQELKKFCDLGHTVALTIHQPSSQLWTLFDKFMLLTRGRVAYMGSVAGALGHFEALRLPCPQYTNPADHYIDVVNDDFRGVELDKEDVPPMTVSYVVAGFEQSDASKMMHVELDAAKNALPLKGESQGHNGALHQFLILSGRNLKNNARNPGIYYVRLVMYAMLCLVLGLMFIGVGDRDDHQDIQSRINLLWYTSSFLIFMSVAVLPFFIEERAVFLREKNNGWYSVGPYVLANAVTALPGIFLIALVCTVALIPLASMNGLGSFLLVLFLGLAASEAMMTLIAVLVPHYIIGIAIGAGAFGFFMLCQGVLLVFDDIPPYFIWGYFIALHTYVFRAMLLNEIDDDDVFNSDIFPTGEAIKEYFSFEDNDFGEDCLVIFCYGIIFHLIVYAWLSRESNGKR